jgi:tRNA dimethylallyltransferase
LASVSSGVSETPILNEDIALRSSMNGLPLAICLMGPTAAGKTDLALALTENLPCDIISVDSALIYKGMDIGTAKPDKAFLEKAPHRLIDIIEPFENYSVAQFYADAYREMQEITAKGRIPLLVGGTMMYYRIIQQGIANLPSADDQVRKEIALDAEQHGWAYIHAQLAKVDPDSALRIKPTDPQRLQRALEVYRVSGKTMTQLWQEQQRETGKTSDNHYTESHVGKITSQDANDQVCSGGLPPLPYRFLNFSIAPLDRKDLHQRIEKRFDFMLKNGLIDEVTGLFHQANISSDMSAMRCVGYRQAWDFLDGKLSYEEMRERGIIATRQLAKRQLTWLRSWPNLYQLDTNDAKVLAKALKIVENAAY